MSHISARLAVEVLGGSQGQAFSRAVYARHWVRVWSLIPVRLKFVKTDMSMWLGCGFWVSLLASVKNARALLYSLQQTYP